MAGPCPTEQTITYKGKTYTFKNSTEFKTWLAEEGREILKDVIDFSKFEGKPSPQTLMDIIVSEAGKTNASGDVLWKNAKAKIKEEYPNIADQYLESAKDELMSGAKKATGIKRAITDFEREVRGEEALDTAFLSRSDQTIYDEAQKQIASGGIKPRELAEVLAENPQNATAEQQMALAIDRVLLNKEYTQAGQEYINAVREGNIDLANQIRIKLDNLERLLDLNDRASAYTGTKLSEAFRIRKRMLADDFSMMRLRINYFKDNPKATTIPEADRKKLEDLEKEVNELRSKLAKIEEERKAAEEQAAIENIKQYEENESKKQQPEPEKPKKKYNLSEEKTKEYNELKKKFAGVMNDFTRIATLMLDKEFYRYVQLSFEDSAGDFKKFAAEMLGTLGKGVRHHVPRLWREMGGKQSDIPGDYKFSNIQERVRELVKSGVTDINDIVRTIQTEMSPEYAGITEREIRDAITKYGEQVNVTKSDLEKLIAVAKREGVLISKIEDAKGGKWPLRKLIGKEGPTPNERAYQRELNELLKELPPDATEEYRKVKSAQATKKTRLKNQIVDLQANIDRAKQGLPIEKKAKKGIPSDQDILDLEAERDAKQIELQELTKEAELTDKEWLGKWKQRAKDNIQKYKDRIANGEFATKKTRNPKEIIKQEKDYEAAQILGELNKAKKKYQAYRNAQKNMQRSKLVRAFEVLAKIPRATVLTSTKVFGKLGSFGVGEMAFMPAMEAMNTIWSYIPLFKQIVKTAPGQGGGGFAGKEILKAWAEWTNPIALWKDIKNIWKTGQTVEMEKLTEDVPEVALDIWGKISDGLDLPGRLHMMAKSPTLRAKTKFYFLKMQKYYEKEYKRLLDEGVASNENPADPMFLLTIQSKAFAMAYNEILLGKNIVGAGWNKFIQALGAPKTEISGTKATGKVLEATVSAKTPVISVPLNYINATIDYTGLGLLKAVANMTAAEYKAAKVNENSLMAEILGHGFKRMSEADKEIIARQLKRGSIGVALLLYGWMNYDEIGGYPIPGEKRKKGKPKTFSQKYFGYELPHWVHLPQLSAIDIGATLHHAYDFYYKKASAEKKKKYGGEVGAIEEGLTAVAKTQLKSVPMVEEPARLREALKDNASTAVYFGEFAKSATIPPDVQKNLYPTMDKPKTFWEAYTTRRRTKEEKEKKVKPDYPSKK